MSIGKRVIIALLLSLVAPQSTMDAYVPILVVSYEKGVHPSNKIESPPPVEKTKKKKRVKKKRIRKKTKKKRHPNKVAANSEGWNSMILGGVLLIIAGPLLMLYLASVGPPVIGTIASIGCSAWLGLVFLGALFYIGWVFGILFILGGLALLIIGVIMKKKHSKKDEERGSYRERKIKELEREAAKRNEREVVENWKKEASIEVEEQYPNFDGDIMDGYLDVSYEVDRLKTELGKLENLIKEDQSNYKTLAPKVKALRLNLKNKKAIQSIYESEHENIRKIPKLKYEYIELKVELAKLRLKKQQYEGKKGKFSENELKTIHQKIKIKEEQLKAITETMNK